MGLRLNVPILFYYFFGTLSGKKSLRCCYANVIKTSKEHVPLNLLSSTLPATCLVVADMYSSKLYRLKFNMYHFIRIVFILKTLKWKCF